MLRARGPGQSLGGQLLFVKDMLFLILVFSKFTFTSIMIHGQDSTNSTPDITSLRYIPAPKTEIQHQLIEDSRHLVDSKLSVQRGRS